MKRENVITRQKFVLGSSSGLAAALSVRRAFTGQSAGAEYNVLKFGAIGDGKSFDTAGIQRAIDTAADRGGGRVIIPGGKRFLVGALNLKSGIELHLADDALLLASTVPADYGTLDGVLNANGCRRLRVKAR